MRALLGSEAYVSVFCLEDVCLPITSWPMKTTSYNYPSHCYCAESYLETPLLFQSSHTLHYVAQGKAFSEALPSLPSTRDLVWRDRGLFGLGASTTGSIHRLDSAARQAPTLPWREQISRGQHEKSPFSPSPPRKPVSTTQRKPGSH